MKTIAMCLSLLCLATAPTAAQEATGVRPVSPPEADVVAQPTDVPPRFEPRAEEWEKHVAGERVCPVMYVDPRDDTVLRIVHSVSSKITSYEGRERVTRETSYGDRWINGPNRYGVQLGQALRIDCVTATSVGIVLRFPRG
ncbi:MAG: hypothetical protein WEF86_01210 [Gemmatimonadota bacterium]